ncbi:MAG TPA: hypothetical protein VFX31_11475 [Ktedonobacterales bacterium]|nr:hypothetical protein [Ktedonobacterales bacterium]
MGATGRAAPLDEALFAALFAALGVATGVSATTLEALGVAGALALETGAESVKLGGRTSVADDAAPAGACGLRAAPFACCGAGLCPV